MTKELAFNSVFVVSFFRFVFMALMEYCLVNIILGDSDAPKPASEPPKPEKVFDLAAKVRTDFNQLNCLMVFMVSNVNITRKMHVC